MPSQAVFLSYASEDAPAAALLAEGVRAAGIEVWFDKTELRGGDAWDQTIRQRIRDCRLFIPIVSQHTEARAEGYFRREWKLAVDRTHDMSDRVAFMIPVVIDGTPEAAADVPTAFRSVQWTRLPGGIASEAFVERLVELIGTSTQVGGLVARIDPLTTVPTRALRRLSPRIVVCALSLAIAIGGGWFAWRHAEVPSAEPSIATSARPADVAHKSIAVLPFIELGDKQTDKLFAEGLAEDLQTLLATLPGLRVTGRLSSARIDNHDVDARSVGKQLGVAYIVEGTVRQFGRRVRVTARLISTEDQMQQWSETYDRELNDILKLQQEIADAIGRALQVEIKHASWQRSSTQVNLDAYVEYLRGLHAFDRYDQVGLQEAVTHYEQALALDPKMIRAREGMADAQFLYYSMGFVPAKLGASRARGVVDAILREDPNSAAAHGVRARLLTTYDWDWVAAQREVDLALSLNRRGQMQLYGAADLANVLGRWDLADRCFREALAIDPLDADTRFEFAYMLRRAGRLAEAESEARRVIEIRPTYPGNHAYLADVLLDSGRAAEALREAQLELDEGLRLTREAEMLYANGRTAESTRALQNAEQRFPETHAYDIAVAHAFRGETDDAFKWLGRAYDQRDYYMQYVRFEPILQRLKSDPRFRALAHRMNLPE